MMNLFPGRRSSTSNTPASSSKDDGLVRYTVSLSDTSGLLVKSNAQSKITISGFSGDPIKFQPLKEGDCIEQVDGKPVPSFDKFQQLLLSSKKLTLVVSRVPPPTRTGSGILNVFKNPQQQKPGFVLSPPPEPQQQQPIAQTPVVVKQQQQQVPLTPAPPPPLPPKPATAAPPVEDNVVRVGNSYDVLHKSPLDEKIRSTATDANAEPLTGWRWRPCTITAIDGNSYTAVFSDTLEGYANSAVFDFDPQVFAKLNSKSPLHVMHHEYMRDDVVDVLDIFHSKFDQRRMQQWRKCQILAVRPYFIRVTFCGWAKAFDLSLHVLEESERIAEFGKYTERLQMEETQQEADFRQAMLKKNLQIVDVSPDGNCLFRAMSVLLFGDQNHHAQIRTRVCDYLLEEAARFSMFLISDGEDGGSFEDYVLNMRKPAEWGGEPELRILEEIYDRPIFMYSRDVVGADNKERDFTLPLAHYNDTDVEEASYCKTVEPLRLSFHGNNHYNAVVVVVSNTTPVKLNSTPEINSGNIRRIRKGPALTTVGKRMSFRAPSMSGQHTPK